MAKKGSGLSAAGWGLLLAVGAIGKAFESSPLAAVAVLVLVAAVGYLVFWASFCHVCGVKLKRSAYFWQVNGESKRLCPNCNRTFERKQSGMAIKKMGL